jgi:hypothetical protein
VKKEKDQLHLNKELLLAIFKKTNADKNKV